MFNLQSKYKLLAEQKDAAASLVKGIRGGRDRQVLLGVTGSGKTFTMANVIQQLQMPALVISHNKTLAGQLYQEMRDFFPDNAVSYFVSYYDYYQGKKSRRKRKSMKSSTSSVSQRRAIF